MQAPSSKVLHRSHLALLITGVLLIGIFVAADIHKNVLSCAAMIRFETLKTETSNDKAVGFAAHRRSLSQRFEPPLAVLRIAKVQYPAQLVTAQAQQQAAEAALAQAERQYARQHEVDKRATTQENIDTSTSQQLSSAASLKSADSWKWKRP